MIPVLKALTCVSKHILYNCLFQTVCDFVFKYVSMQSALMLALVRHCDFETQEICFVFLDPFKYCLPAMIKHYHIYILMYCQYLSINVLTSKFPISDSPTFNFHVHSKIQVYTIIPVVKLRNLMKLKAVHWLIKFHMTLLHVK